MNVRRSRSDNPNSAASSMSGEGASYPVQLAVTMLPIRAGSTPANACPTDRRPISSAPCFHRRIRSPARSAPPSFQPAGSQYQCRLRIPALRKIDSAVGTAANRCRKTLSNVSTWSMIRSGTAYARVAMRGTRCWDNVVLLTLEYDKSAHASTGSTACGSFPSPERALRTTSGHRSTTRRRGGESRGEHPADLGHRSGLHHVLVAAGDRVVVDVPVDVRQP